MHRTLRLLFLFIALSSFVLIASAAGAGIPPIDMSNRTDFADFEQPSPASFP